MAASLGGLSRTFAPEVPSEAQRDTAAGLTLAGQGAKLADMGGLGVPYAGPALGLASFLNDPSPSSAAGAAGSVAPYALSYGMDALKSAAPDTAKSLSSFAGGAASYLPWIGGALSLATSPHGADSQNVNTVASLLGSQISSAALAPAIAAGALPAAASGAGALVALPAILGGIFGSGGPLGPRGETPMSPAERGAQGFADRAHAYTDPSQWSGLGRVFAAQSPYDYNRLATGFARNAFTGQELAAGQGNPAGPFFGGAAAGQVDPANMVNPDNPTAGTAFDNYTASYRAGTLPTTRMLTADDVMAGTPSPAASAALAGDPQLARAVGAGDRVMAQNLLYDQPVSVQATAPTDAQKRRQADRESMVQA